MELPYSNLQVKHWNPGASQPLVLPVQVVCNTPEETLAENIRINSRRPGDWLATQPVRAGAVLLCGSGPSLLDDLDDIRARVSEGATLIALNGAAALLHSKGLTPDYQIILDAQAETANLVGPARAHLFASQCHPDTFERAPAAQAWHLQIEGIDDWLPEYPKPFALIGAASSVGTTALIVAFALGFRDVHCFGYDSSNRGEVSHAAHQPMNDGEPMCSVRFNGKDYRCSLTMKLQAERFPETARLLAREGCAVHVHGYGLLPDIWNAPVEDLTEREKYQRLWTMPDYRASAPGEDWAPLFLKLAQPGEGASVIDFGCGTGRGALALHLANLDVTLVDFAANSRDPGAAHLPFIEWDLTEPLPLRAEYGFCTDVLEHIPPADTRKVLANLFASAARVFISVDTKADICGALINQRLHLTLMHHEEWRQLLAEYGEIVFDAHERDTSVFYVVRRNV